MEKTVDLRSSFAVLYELDRIDSKEMVECAKEMARTLENDGHTKEAKEIMAFANKRQQRLQAQY